MRIKTMLENGAVELKESIPFIYGAKLESPTDFVSHLSEDSFTSLAKKYVFSGTPTWFWLLVRREKIKNYANAFKTEVFVLSSSGDFLKDFCSVFPNYRQVSSKETVNFLFRLITNSDKAVFERKEREVFYPDLPYFDEDKIYSVFLRDKFVPLIKNEWERLRRKGKFPFRLFKVFDVLETTPSLEEFFSVPFSGYLVLRFGIGNFYSVLRQRENGVGAPPDRAKRWREIAEKVKNGELLLFPFEGTFVHFLDEETPTKVFSSLSFLAFEWFFSWEKVLLNPITTTAPALELFLYPERIAKLIPLSFKKTTTATIRDALTVYGISPYENREEGEIELFNLVEEGKFHSSWFAPQRSGKSFAVQGFLCEVIGVSPKELYLGCSPRDLPVKVAYFDVGFSAEFLVKLLKARGFKVEVVNPSVSVKVNVCGAKKLDEVPFYLGLINTFLSQNGIEPLNGYEENILRKAYKKIFEGEVPLISEKVQLSALSSVGYESFYEEAKKKGIKDETPITKVPLPSFKVFKVPIALDLKTAVDSLRKSLTQEELKHLDSLLVKLSVIADNPQFTAWSEFYFDESLDFFYVDLHYIKSNKFFQTIYLAILNELFSVFSSPSVFSVPKLFIADEFHNVSRIPAFSSYFEILIREAAKRNFSLLLLSQSPKDFPEGVNENIATKVILRAYKGEESFLKSCKEVFGMSDEAIAYYKKLPRYTPLFYLGEKEFFSLRPEIDEFALKVFESRTITEIKTPDGIIIKKTFVEEE